MIALLAWIVVFTGAAGVLARKRDRTMAIWMVFGALLGPVALLLLWIAPPGRCGTCRASVRGWSSMCEWCGSPVGVTSAAPAAALAAAGPARAAVATAPGKSSRTTRAAEPAADIRGSVETATDDRIRERLTSLSSRRAANAAATVSSGDVPEPPRASRASDGGPHHVLATAVYVTGTVPLVAGSRYALDVGAGTLRILGPTDIDPTAVALTQVLAGMEATGFDERLVLTFGGGGRHGMVLVFTALDGSSAAGVSAAILTAARATRVAS